MRFDVYPIIGASYMCDILQMKVLGSKYMFFQFVAEILGCRRFQANYF